MENYRTLQWWLYLKLFFFIFLPRKSTQNFFYYTKFKRRVIELRSFSSWKTTQNLQTKLLWRLNCITYYKMQIFGSPLYGRKGGKTFLFCSTLQSPYLDILTEKEERKPSKCWVWWLVVDESECEGKVFHFHTHPHSFLCDEMHENDEKKDFKFKCESFRFLRFEESN